MSTVTGGLFKRVWYAWKSYRLPWRRHQFIGMDLEGNTYWEFKNPNGGARARRIVQYKDMKRDFVDYKLTPQWHQWLRATRTDPPTIRELEEDILRIRALKVNAALADARWAAKPSLLDAGPRPAAENVIGSRTKLGNDTGLQKPGDQPEGKDEVGADLGGKGVEAQVDAGGSTGDRAHESRGLEAEVGKRDPWEDAGGKGEFKHGEWDPNKGLLKSR